jgi:hypothetical protein
VRPEESLAAWLAPVFDHWYRVPASWRHGTVDYWDGEPVPHAMWLAANDLASLEKRIWRGQVAALLPWIEETRCRVITLCRRRLRPDESDPGRPSASVEDLDWGSLLRQLSDKSARTPGWVLRLVQQMRRVRNELAHGRPATWPSIRHCLEAWRDWGDALSNAAANRPHRPHRSCC